jgi:DNA-binding transcriptional regulator YiaG
MNQTSASRGRPKKSDAKTKVEVYKEYRDSLKAEGKKAVNAYLTAETRDTLARICKAKSMTIAEAIEWAISQAIAFDAITKSNEPSRVMGFYQRTVMERLQDARTSAAYSEADMADHIQVPLSRYRKWEAGLEKIPNKYLNAVVRLLNLPYDYFCNK